MIIAHDIFHQNLLHRKINDIPVSLLFFIEIIVILIGVLLGSTAKQWKDSQTKVKTVKLAVSSWQLR